MSNANPTRATANRRDATPELRFAFPVDMMFSILLRKLEPLAAPVTPATRQPKQKRTTFRMLEA